MIFVELLRGCGWRWNRTDYDGLGAEATVIMARTEGKGGRWSEIRVSAYKHHVFSLIKCYQPCG